MTTKSVILKAWEENNQTVTAFQGEVNSRFLQITLIDNNGAIDLTNKNVQFYAKKPDGTVIFNNAEIVDDKEGIINIILTSQMSAVSGILENCEIRVTGADGATLKFSGFNIIINKTLPDTKVESSSEFTALQEAIGKAGAIGNHANLKNNPHNVTAEQVGAAKADHSHSFNSINNTPTTLDGYGITDAVCNTRTINNKALSNDIVLTANDINAATIEQGTKADTAVQSSEKGEANGVATLDSNSKLVQLPSPDDINAVPTSRTVNSKPLSSNITLTASDVGALPDTTSIPSKISDLQNDSGFITGYTETDPTVPSWAKTSSKPSYSFSEIASKPNTLSGYGITDAATLAQGIKADSSIQGIKNSSNTLLTVNPDKTISLKDSDIETVDTITITITFNSDSQQVHLYRVGRVVFCEYININGAIPPASWTEIGTLPTGWRPMYNISMAPANTADNIGTPRFQVTTDGKINIAKYGASIQQTHGWFFCIPTYICAK